MNASNNAASANAAAVAAAAATGAAAQRLSPLEGSITHLNNLANSSQTQQLTNTTQQSSSCTSAPTSSNTTQQPVYIKKWACNVSIISQQFLFEILIFHLIFFIFRLVLMKTFQKVLNVPCAVVPVIVIVHRPPITLRIMPAVLVIIKQT